MKNEVITEFRASRPEELVAKRASMALDKPLTDHEREEMIEAASVKIGELFDILRIDHRNDHNTKQTPTRVAKSFVNELLSGRFAAPPKVTDFDNAEAYGDIIFTGPIHVRSLCAHHMLPIYGEAYFGIQPQEGGRIVGLSKYDRIVDHFARRMHSQEELVNQIGEFVTDLTKPAGLALRISAVHMCKSHRGVSASHASRMSTTFTYGTFADDPARRGEFNAECLARQAQL